MNQTGSCCEQAAPNLEAKGTKKIKVFLNLWGVSLVSLVLLVLGLFGEQYLPFKLVGINFWLTAYLLAYLLVGLPVLKKGWKSILQGEVFTEFFLMGLATLGAFAIGEYPEAVAVMLFYTIGEVFQHKAVNKAKSNIQSLLDLRPDKARVYRNGHLVTVSPEDVAIGETIEVKAGERLPLDGILTKESGSFNAVAITGESKPKKRNLGEEVLAGMVNLQNLNTIKVTKNFQESSLSKIIKTIQDATSKKAPTEQFIRKFAKIYTPIVTYLALGLVVIPYFFVGEYEFSDWLYRALVFLVISCPCALVISIPLGYFGGIGAASRAGILFKGSSYLDLITKVNTFIFDKTGTLTQGVFEVQKTVNAPNAPSDWQVVAASLEQKSNHPIAKALIDHAGREKLHPVEQLSEATGRGLMGTIMGRKVLVGNALLMKENKIEYEPFIGTATVIHVAIDQQYCGHFTIDDQTKEDTQTAINELREMGIHDLYMLSGDKQEVVTQLGKELGMDQALGELLPEQKVAFVEKLKTDKGRVIGFAGDGINDGPVLALAHVGIAMGSMGSDLAIQTADVVIQTDQPSKIALAIRIGKTTKVIVWQNIAMAFGVKALILVLGAAGMAGMWEAVFADVGVALLAILNAIRINKIFN